ncbi:Mycobacterium numidiamassiliense ORFan [Mycobacterium numidiamassiliense]|uniref:Mycobacterium numidiamassiliense ORFan n=1 Tax=Mycobacterium numidiamassiliense TaxID=1841861 RepID=A0A2U3PBG9_9MYCO|nr:hypothetical protein [Mycobacterium numidiamassiliense]SPM41081.1 Mycobacterium numidiamassiliense ORFan [Mycobacterium numidiamassiliense]
MSEHSPISGATQDLGPGLWLNSVPIPNTAAAAGTGPSYLYMVDANWFYLFYRGTDNKLMWCQKEFGAQWSPGKALKESDPGLVTAFSPAAAAWPVRGPEPSLLYVFFVRPNDSKNQIWFTVFDGANWSQGEPLVTQDGQTQSTPTSPAAIHVNDKLYVFFKADDPSNRIIYTFFDGKNWAPSRYINDVEDHTSAAPAVVFFNGGLYIFFKGDGNNQVAMCKPSPDGRWLPCQVLNDASGPIITSPAPAAMVLRGQLCVFYTPNSNNPMKYCLGTPDQTPWTSWDINDVDHPNSTPAGGPASGHRNDQRIWFVPAVAGTSEIRESMHKDDPDPKKFLDNWNWAATDPTWSDDYLNTCPGGNPFITWQGRQWWINYWWDTLSGTWQGSGYQSNFDPTRFFTPGPGQDELTLCTFDPNRPGDDPKEACITAEIVLADLLGYGDYVLTVRANEPKQFGAFEPNVCFGAFTYQFGISTEETNQHREIDMLETLSYGSQLRKPGTNAQFTLQPAIDTVINRFPIPADCSVVTLWLRRQDPEVVGSWDTGLFIFNGSYSLEQIRSGKIPQSIHNWLPTTSAGGKERLPHHTPESRERLHINLYLTSTQVPSHPAGFPPQNPHSVILTRFEFAELP